MAFVNEYHYELADYGVGVVQQKVYYRFQLPKLEINTRPIVPRQIELFSRLPINYQLKFETATTPLHFDNGPSLSAIILDDSYYELLKNNVQHLNQMPILNAAALIFFKAKAHLDIIARQAAGQKIKHRADTSKHFKDVCRLTSLLPVNGFDPLAVPKDCQHDLQHFIMLLVKEDAMIFKRRFRANRDFNLTQAEVVTNLRRLLP